MSDEFDKLGDSLDESNQSEDIGGELDDDFGFDMDDGLGIDPFNPPKDTRKPITKVASSAVTELTNLEHAPKVAMRIASKALPKEYSAAFDTASDIKGKVGDIYDDAAKQLKPTTTLIKSGIRKHTKLVDKLLPKKLAAKVIGFGNDVDSNSGVKSLEAQRLESRDREVASVFEKFLASQKVNTVIDANSADATAEVSRKEFITDMTVQKRMADGIASLVGYQNSVLVQFQKKSLELQHLQYFALQDITTLLRKTGEDTLSNLGAISVNTSLPNEVKLRKTEILGRIAINDVLGKVHDNVATKLSKLPAKLAKNGTTFLTDKIGGINDAADGISQLGGGGGEDSFGPTKEEMAGGGIADMIHNFLGIKSADLLKDLIKNNATASSFIAKGAKNLAFLSDNTPEMMNQILKSDTPMGEVLRGIFGDPEGTTNAKVSNVLISDPLAPTPWDMMSRQTLVEIIPGFLSRQLEQLTNIATGTLNERIVYSAEREQFVSKTQAVTEVRNRLDNNFNSNLKTTSDDLIKILDPKGTLSPSAHFLLATELIKDSSRGDMIDPKRYLKLTSGSKEDQAAVKQVFQSYFGKVINKPKLNLSEIDGVLAKGQAVKAAAADTFDINAKLKDLDKNYKSLGSSMVDTTLDIGKSVITGNKELLRDAGIIKKEGAIDVVNKDYGNNRIADVLNGVDLNIHRSPLNRDNNSTTASDVAANQTILNNRGTNRNIGSKSDSELDPVTRDILANIDTNISTILGTIESNYSKQQESLVSSKDTTTAFNYEYFSAINNLAPIAKSNDEIVTLLKGLQNGLVSKGGLLGKDGIVSTIIKGSMAGISGAYKGGLGTLKGLGNFSSKSIFGLAGGFKDIALGLLNKGKGKAKTVSDILIKTATGMRVAIREDLLKSGTLIDVNTGKMIKSIKDITGEVKDSTGKVVLSAAEFASGLHMPDGKKIKGLFSKVVGGITSTGLLALSPGMLTARFALGLAKRSYASIKGLIDGPIDIYIPGVKMPKLYASGFTNGAYFSALTGKVLRSHKDIDGPVLDKDGKVMLSDEDMRNGIFNVRGAKVIAKGIIERIRGLAVGAFNTAKKLSLGALNISKRAVMGGLGVLGGLKDSILGTSDGEGGKVKGGKGTLERILAVVTDIRDGTKGGKRKVPKAGLNKDGTRIGGFRDKLAKRKAALLAKRKADKAARAKRGGGNHVGRFGKITGALGMGGLLPGGNKDSDSPTDSDNDESGIDANDVLTYGSVLALAKDYVLGKGKAALGGISKAGSYIAKKVGLGGAGKALTGAGALAKANSFGKATKVASAAMKAKKLYTAAKVGAGVAAGSAAVASGAGLGGAAAAALGLTNPVGWAILAGTALYYGYGYLKDRKLDKETTGPLETLRFLQYGIPVNELKAIRAIRTLEDYLDGEIDIDIKNGSISKGPDMDDIWSEVAEAFGSTEDNVPRAEIFAQWYIHRFYPIYTLNLYRTKELDIDLVGIDDDIDDDKVYGYVKSTAPVVIPGTPHPYFVKDSPFPDLEISIDRTLIDALTAKLLGEYLLNSKGKLQNEPDKEGIMNTIDKDIKRKEAEVNKEVKNTSLENSFNKFYKGNKAANKLALLASATPQTLQLNDVGTPKGVGDNVKAATYSNNVISLAASKGGKSGQDETLSVPAAGRLSSAFGDRTHPISGGKKMHKGIDIAAPRGTPIYAANDGKVVRAVRSTSYGNVVYLDHSNGRQTRYAHMSSFANGITTGVNVVRGQMIGRVGSTGHSTGNHLHFEYREKDKKTILNPTAYFPKDKSMLAAMDIDVDKEGKGAESVSIADSTSSDSETKIASITPDTSLTGSFNDSVTNVGRALNNQPKPVVSATTAGINTPAVSELSIAGIGELSKGNDRLVKQSSEIGNSQLALAQGTNDKLDKLIDIMAENAKSSESIASTITTANNTQVDNTVTSTSTVNPVVPLTRRDGSKWG